MIKSILAGIAIGIGALINLKVGGIAGAIFFSVGLFLVCIFRLNLYTGKVGYTGVAENLPILLGNAIGCMFLLLYPMDNAKTIIANKLSTPFYITFINAIICGILIYAAVEAFKQGREYMILICVPAFILCGAEHCVADICYAASARIISVDLVYFILTVVIGNSIGSYVFRAITEEEA